MRITIIYIGITGMRLIAKTIFENINNSTDNNVALNIEITCWQLRKKIRYAEAPDNPELVSQWLEFESSRIKLVNIDHWVSYVNQFNLLVNVLADDLLPSHWRGHCLNSIYQPLTQLHRLAKTDRHKQHLTKLLTELRNTSYYFQNGIRC